MRRVVIDRPGGHDRLRIEEAPDPALRPGTLAIDVEAIGVNYADCVTRMAEYRLEDVGAAHAALESGSTVGKLVLIP